MRFYVKKSEGVTMGAKGLLFLVASVLLSLGTGFLLGWLLGREHLRGELKEAPRV